MPRYLSFDPNVEIIGATALSLITNILHEDIAEILKRHGLHQINPSEWYSLQSVLDVMNDIAANDNASSTFVSIGMTAGKIGYESLPAEVQQMSLGDFLELYSKHYQGRFRNGDVGWIKMDRENRHHFIITSHIPFPDDVFYGVFYAYARVLRPEGKGFVVQYDDRFRRDYGGDVTVVHIEIEA